MKNNKSFKKEYKTFNKDPINYMTKNFFNNKKIQESVINPILSNLIAYQSTVCVYPDYAGDYNIQDFIKNQDQSFKECKAKFDNLSDDKKQQYKDLFNTAFAELTNAPWHQNNDNQVYSRIITQGALNILFNELFFGKDALSEEIADKIPQSASTIHRYLGIQPGQHSFLHDERNRTSSDVILVDESSMVSLPLFHSLLKALKDDCRVILLGDKDQLTAVENGNVLGELTGFENINSFSKPFCESYASATGAEFNFIDDNASLLQDLILKLEHSYRFGKDSPVGRLARLINEPPEDLSSGHFKSLFNEEKAGENYVSWQDLPEIYERSIFPHIESVQSFFRDYKQCLNSESPQEVLDALNQFRVLTATRVGKYGSENLNREISRHYFGRDDNDLYPGRCIMISTNDHSLELYNGDIGVILEKEGIPTAFFPGKEEVLRSFSPSVLPDFETAFAMTIHKSQGSEYDRILMLLPDGDHITRQLLYTGITRARKSVEILCDLRTLLKAAKNSTKRFSGLRKRL